MLIMPANTCRLCTIAGGFRNLPGCMTATNRYNVASINDVTAREHQFHTHQFMLGKNPDKSAPIGPVVVTYWPLNRIAWH